ncbi:hypothetical protein PG995_015509 [Apiospora arundinis]
MILVWPPDQAELKTVFARFFAQSMAEAPASPAIQIIQWHEVHKSGFNLSCTFLSSISSLLFNIIGESIRRFAEELGASGTQKARLSRCEVLLMVLRGGRSASNASNVRDIELSLILKLGERIVGLQKQASKHGIASMKWLHGRRLSMELDGIIAEFESNVQLYRDVTQESVNLLFQAVAIAHISNHWTQTRERLRRLEDEMRHSHGRLQDDIHAFQASILSEVGQFNRASQIIGEMVQELNTSIANLRDEVRNPNSRVLEELETVPRDVQPEQSSHGSGDEATVSESPRPTAESPAAADKKGKSKGRAQPMTKRIDIFTGQITPDIGVDAILDLDSHDCWIRQDLVKELRLEKESTDEKMVVGPKGATLIPDGQVKMTWSSDNDSKSTTTFLVHGLIDDKVVLGGGYLAEATDVSSPSAFPYWRSAMKEAETRKRAREVQEANAPMVEEQRREDSETLQKRARARKEMSSGATSPHNSSLSNLSNAQHPDPMLSSILPPVPLAQHNDKGKGLAGQSSEPSSVRALELGKSNVTSQEDMTRDSRTYYLGIKRGEMGHEQ